MSLPTSAYFFQAALARPFWRRTVRTMMLVELWLPSQFLLQTTGAPPRDARHFARHRQPCRRHRARVAAPQDLI